MPGMTELSPSLLEANGLLWLNWAQWGSLQQGTAHHFADENAHFSPPPPLREEAESFPGALPGGKIYPLNTILHHTEQRKSLKDLFHIWDISLGAVNQCYPTDITEAIPICTSRESDLAKAWWHGWEMQVKVYLVFQHKSANAGKETVCGKVPAVLPFFNAKPSDWNSTVKLSSFVSKLKSQDSSIFEKHHRCFLDGCFALSIEK